MKRMLNPDKVIKSVKIADDESQALIPKESFRIDFYGFYFTNIQTINQSGSDGCGYLRVVVDGENTDIQLFRNSSYSIGAFQSGSSVILVVNGIVHDEVSETIKPEMVVTLQNSLIDVVLSTMEIGGSEEFDLYVLK